MLLQVYLLKVNSMARTTMNRKLTGVSLVDHAKVQNNLNATTFSDSILNVTASIAKGT